VSGLFTSAPFVDCVWSEPKPAGLSDWTRIAGAIRTRGFDLALLLPNSFESALMMYLARVPQRIGYATDGRTWMLTNGMKPSREHRHQVHYYLDLVKMLSGGTSQPSIEISARQLLQTEGLPAGAPFLVLNPGAAYGSAKRWYPDRFARAADTVAQEFGFHVVLIGSEAERAIAQEIAAQSKSKTVVLSGKTSLETLIGILAESSVMITNDSGPMHIAAALGIPTVAVFGSTDDIVTGPCGARTRIVKQAVECSPCLLRDCPIDHRCMDRVTVDHVCRAARELLSA
jgi:heptosyltransferase-2